jgi:hypothetical protein
MVKSHHPTVKMEIVVPIKRRSRSHVLPKRIGLGIPGRTLVQIPLCEWHPDYKCWRVWISYDPTITAGTYLELNPDGSAHRITSQPNGDISHHVLEA